MIPSIKIEEVATPHGVVTLFNIINRSGASVRLSSLGAGIVSIIVPDKNKKPTDIVLGYDNNADYFLDSPCSGKTPGRFANRIANARFVLDGNTYTLTANDGDNSLHGGECGFQNRIWDYKITPEGVEFSYLSPDGEEGYPGNLHAIVRYTWNDDNSLLIELEATSDSTTLINLTNHAYFNLHGVENGNCLDHMLTIYGSSRVKTDAHDIPTGEIADVEDTPFDFRTPKELGCDIFRDFENLKSGKGYNHYFFIGNQGQDIINNSTSGNEMKAATLYDELSGITLDIFTTLPGIMLYTGNWLDDSPIGKRGLIYHDHDGVAIECQYPPDAPNQPLFPSPILRHNDKYSHRIIYKLSTDSDNSINIIENY